MKLTGLWQQCIHHIYIPLDAVTSMTWLSSRRHVVWMTVDTNIAIITAVVPTIRMTSNAKLSPSSNIISLSGHDMHSSTGNGSSSVLLTVEFIVKFCYYCALHMNVVLFIVCRTFPSTPFPPTFLFWERRGGRHRPLVHEWSMQ